MKNLIVYIILFTSSVAFGGNRFYENYTWQKSPSNTSLTEEEKSQRAVILKDVRVIQFEYMEGNPVVYETKHKIIKVLSDRAIEEYNKVYIPIYSNVLVDVNARSISPDGKITHIDEDDIKTKDNLKGYGTFKMFAIEGIVKGSVIEYIYTIKKGMPLVGREVFQSDIPTKVSEFKIITDEYTSIDAKSYNGFSKVVSEETENGKTITAKMENIPALYEEKYAAYKANLMRVDFKVLNIVKGDDGDYMNNWKRIAESVAGQYYSFERLKDIKTILSNLNLSSLNTEEQIETIERYVKSSYIVKESNSPELSDLATILKTRNASEIGIVKLYAALFLDAGITIEIISTTNRFQQKFDPDFSSYLQLDKTLLYFPDTEHYIVPTVSYFRHSFIPTPYGDNEGLVTRIGYGGVEYETRYLDFPTIKNNKVETNIKVEFSNDLSKIDVHKTHKSNGYRGANNRASYFYTPKKKDYVKETITYGAVDDLEIIDFSVKNEVLDLNATPSSKFTVDASLKVSSLVEWAGNDYIFQVGLTIGTQAEIYEEHERTNPITVNHPIEYLHDIQVIVPEGYTVKGIEDLAIDKYLEDEMGKRVLQFKSTYTLKDNVLDIHIQEFYKRMSFHKRHYKKFRDVINAAADFNKVSIVFVKK